MPPTATEAVPRPLTDAERKTLDDLLARSSGTPATRVGEPYLALTALSVPRRGDKDRATDLVMAGETVYLTEDEARAFNRHGTRDGRQVDVVQKLSGPDGSRVEPARIPPRALSGRLFRPTMPPPGTELPRPDPEGSSAIQVLDEGRAPETGGAMVPEPSEMDDNLRAQPLPDAVDLPPSRQGRPQNRGR
jgi:hypothetical protein